MKLAFNKEDLLHAIQIIQSSVPSKSTLPILSNLLLYTDPDNKDSVTFEATDLEVGIRCTANAEVSKEGKITVPAKKLGELVKEMPNGKKIELTTNDGKKIEFKCGSIHASLHSMSPEDFPVIPQFPQDKSFQLEKATFREMIKKTYFAASTDETRYILNGIHFGANAGELRMVATDGRRLAFISKNGAEKNLSANVIIPSKAISELLRLLSLDEGNKDDKIHIAPYENQISFKWTSDNISIVLVSRVIDGTFPNYDQVIPKSKEIELKVKTSDILSAVKRASLFAQDRGGSVRFSLGKKLLKISANANGLGDEEEEIVVDYAGSDFEIAFNPAFLLDTLKNNDSPSVQFEFSTALNPGLIKPSNNENYLCVVMPMRLQ